MGDVPAAIFAGLVISLWNRYVVPLLPNPCSDTGHDDSSSSTASTVEILSDASCHTSGHG